MRSVGKGMTVLSADKDYQKKRQKSLARQTDSMREGFARAGRRLVLVSITTRLSLPLDFTIYDTHTHTHTRLTALFRDYPGEPVPER